MARYVCIKCKTCDYINQEWYNWPCIDCCEGDRYKNEKEYEKEHNEREN